MCSCHSILECCVTFSGVKLSMGSFVLFIVPQKQIRDKIRNQMIFSPVSFRNYVFLIFYET